MTRTGWCSGVMVAALVFSGTAWGADEIVLGSAISQTGKYAREGKFYVDAYALTVDAVNKAGGVKVGGKAYKLVLEDVRRPERSEPERPPLHPSRHLRQGQLPARPLLERHHHPGERRVREVRDPDGAGRGSLGKIFDRGYKYIFGTLPKAEFYFQAVIEAAAKFTPRVQTAALLYSNEAFDRSVADGARQWLKEQKIDKIYDEEYQPATQDFTSILAVLKSKGPDLVLVAGHEENALNFIRQAQAADMAPKMMVFTVGPPTADFRKTLGKAAEYVFGITPWLPDMDVGARSSSRPVTSPSSSRSASATRPTTTSPRARPTSSRTSSPIEKAGSLDPKKVRDALAALDAETIYGRVKFEATGQIAMGQVVVQIQEGKLVPVYAGGKALAKPVYPAPKWNMRK